jgi:hypothetical protein
MLPTFPATGLIQGWVPYAPSPATISGRGAKEVRDLSPGPGEQLRLAADEQEGQSRLQRRGIRGGVDQRRLHAVLPAGAQGERGALRPSRQAVPGLPGVAGADRQLVHGIAGGPGDAQQGADETGGGSGTVQALYRATRVVTDRRGWVPYSPLAWRHEADQVRHLGVHGVRAGARRVPVRHARADVAGRAEPARSCVRPPGPRVPGAQAKVRLIPAQS